MTNKLFKSFFAVAMLLGSALGFVACENEGDDVVADPKVEVSATSLNFTNEEGNQTLEVTANADWKAETDADWVTITPAAGKGDATITVAVSANDTGAVRTTVVKVIALHKEYGAWDTKKVTVSQSATETPIVEEELLYSDDFDGEEATKTYGSGSSWPYIDQFPQFANPEGPAAENVTYSGKGVSVRANSTSDSQYSDYAGSGSNNIFFGSSAYFQVNNITLAEGQQNLKLTFGSEKYTQDGDSTFKPEEFRIYVSKDGNAWAEIKEYTFAGTEGGRWNVATAEFTLNAVPETLYLKFAASVASVYRLDDVKLYTGNGGQTIDLDNIETPQPSEAKKVTVAEFLAAAEDSTIYELTGEITRMYRENNENDILYGNFYLKDATGEVLIYGLMDKDGNKYWTASGVKIGDTITVQTIRTSYNGTPQGKNATYISHTAGSGETPEPEPTPGDTMTIADVLAKGEGATIGGVIEGVVISNMDLNNLTSKKGLYVQDETGALQFYLAANHEFAFGTKVKIDLTTATLGSYNGAVQVSGVSLDKITVVSTGNAVEAKTVSMADFLANKYEGQYIALEGVQVAASDLSKTWVMGGAHTSIAMEDANGNSFVVFSSKYASYGAETVAQGAGTIKGISSISKGAIQIIFAQTTDYAGLNGERFGDAGGEEPEQPGDEPVVPEGWAGRDDFNTLDSNSSYAARESTAGWVGENCAVQAGGANDSNPVFNSLLGADTNARAWVINGKTSAVGKITSPVITTGCGTLQFTYGMAFTEKNGYNFTVNIMQNGEVVKSFDVVNADNTKFAKYTFSEEVNVAGDFQIVITNNCPSANADSNKDRYSIWDIMWTAHN